MRRPVLLAALAASVALASCGGSSATTGPGSSGGGLASGAASVAAPAGTTTAGSSWTTQFGGNVCSALTKAEIEAASYPQGSAKFDSTDTQKDPTTGTAVVCQYLVVFGSNPSIVGAAVSLMGDDEYGTRTSVSLIAPPSAIPGIGSEAFLVQPAPGLFEVWVAGPHGKFKIGAQSQDTAVALAKIATPRD